MLYRVLRPYDKFFFLIDAIVCFLNHTYVFTGQMDVLIRRISELAARHYELWTVQCCTA